MELPGIEIEKVFLLLFRAFEYKEKVMYAIDRLNAHCKCLYLVLSASDIHFSNQRAIDIIDAYLHNATVKWTLGINRKLLRPVLEVYTADTNIVTLINSSDELVPFLIAPRVLGSSAHSIAP